MRDMIEQLQELQVRRRHYIKTGTKLTNAAGALVRRALGWSKDAEDAEAIKGRAAKIVARYMSKGALVGDDAAIGEALAFDLDVAREQMAISDRARHSIELAMKRAARKLPGHGFAKGVLGFGDLALAVLIGEAGDLSKYSHPDKLKKRLGLAPYAGKALSNWRRGGGLTSQEWEGLGYAPRRRAEVFAVVEDPLFRHQASRAGPYHAIYLKRRERTAETHPDWSKGHSHGDAKRIMVQRLVSDLWSEWRRASEAMPAVAEEASPVSTETPSPQGEAADRGQLQTTDGMAVGHASRAPVGELEDA
jgi:hypothetical protein